MENDAYSTSKPEWFQHRWMKRALWGVLIVLPVLLGLYYQKSAHALYKRLLYPRAVSISAGVEDGRFEQLATALASEINRSGIGSRASVVQSSGSLENLRRLRAGEVKLALYQPGTVQFLLREEAAEFPEVRFMANLYSQPLHLIVRSGAGIAKAEDLRGKTVQLGTKDSGDYAVSHVLLHHLGLSESDIRPVYQDYRNLGARFADESLDAAIVTSGVHAPVFRDLFDAGNCQLLPIPNREALTWRHLSFSTIEIPEGIYGSHPHEPIETVAIGAHLLAHEDLPNGLIKEIADLLMKEDFLKTNHLRELFLDKTFAEQRPSFAVHPGAKAFYQDDFDLQIFESLDALHSLIVSFFIAVLLLVRTVKERQNRKVEHLLDRYIKELLRIERCQLALDVEVSEADLRALQGLLDEVTHLRQEALKGIDAEQLNEDPAAGAFIGMCHALSDKINSKITRQRFDLGLQALAQRLAGAERHAGPDGEGGNLGNGN